MSRTFWANRQQGRAVSFTICLLCLWAFSRVFELRQSSWSCRTLPSCLGIGTHRLYDYTKPNPSEFAAHEEVLRDGTLHYRRLANNTDPSILILALNQDEASWSSDFRETRRTVYDFLDVLLSTGLNPIDVSLAIMTASLDEYHKIQTATEVLPFARV
jgi:hypothetical protein